ncbi:MAG TPA: SPOR domain-containing protein [Patescibacteria group bacterium]|nr:SPOR domain-containing protein [Patescibacteria group bacterium]
MLKIFFALIFLFVSGDVLAQTSALVNSKLRLVARGRIDEVRASMPELLKNYPGDVGVIFLNAIILDNAVQALTTYESIVQNSPESEWADDAQWRIVQYYALKRDTARAHAELQQYRENYSTSEFLLSATEIVRATVGPPRLVRTLSSANATTTSKTISPTSEAPVNGASKSAEQIEKPRRYTLQVGSYVLLESAEAEVTRFKNKRLRAAVLPKVSGAERTYAVTIGDYSSREAAEKAIPIVKEQCGCEPFVLEK